MSSEPWSSSRVAQSLLDGTDTTDPVVALVQVMLSGFGYNFHNPANVARANDQLVRARASQLLGEAAQALTGLEAEFRTTSIPPSTRDQPFPSEKIMKALRRLTALRTRLHGLGSAALTQEAPASDRIWARLRDERELLRELLAADIAAVKQAGDVLTAAKALTVVSVEREELGPAEEAAATLDAVIRARRSLLG